MEAWMSRVALVTLLAAEETLDEPPTVSQRRQASRIAVADRVITRILIQRAHVGTRVLLGESTGCRIVITSPVVVGTVLIKLATGVAERVRHAGGHRSAAERVRSEEHTSELQSPDHLVCRL